jgi:hypothetical protein
MCSKEIRLERFTESFLLNKGKERKRVCPTTEEIITAGMGASVPVIKGRSGTGRVARSELSSKIKFGCKKYSK